MVVDDDRRDARRDPTAEQGGHEQRQDDRLRVGGWGLAHESLRVVRIAEATVKSI
jgi:hypothetical protein